jgi:DNA-binding CsgD family transcriptional regulator
VANGESVVGREAEMAAVRAFVDTPPSAPAALMLAGEPGMGKSTLIRAALILAAAAELRPLVARPARGEAELPYVGLADLFAELGRDDLEGLALPQRNAIEAALARAELKSVGAHALSRGVLELFKRTAADGNALLCVDDVQWLDRPTASVLEFALRRLVATPIRVLVAIRTENGSGRPLPLGLADWENVRRIELGPMSPTELGVLLAQHQGEQLPRPRIESLHRLSGGNPMLALELASRRQLGEGDDAPTLARATEARVRALDASSRRAVSFTAAALRPSTDLLLRAGVGEDDLKSAVANGILRIDGERLSFAHPLLAAAAYDLLLPSERREIHSALAAASTNAVEQGHHVSRSVLERDESAALILDQAAEEAALLGDHAGAAAFLVRAADLSPKSDGDTAERRLGAAAQLELAGDTDAAAAVARELVDELPPGVIRAKARRFLVACAGGLSYGDSDAELALALEDAGHDELTRAEIHLSMAEIANAMCRLDDAAAHARQAIALAERAGRPTLAAYGLSELGAAECLLGRGVSDAARLAFERWDGMFALDVYSPRMALGCAYLYSTNFDRAAELLTEELDTAAAYGLEPVEVMARGLLAEAELRAGRFAEALRDARDAHDHALQAAHEQIVWGSSYALAMANALLGRHDEARALASAALDFADAAEDFWFKTYHRSVLAFVALAEDDPQSAAEVGEPAWALLVERGLGELSISSVTPLLGEALVAVGRSEEAAAVANHLRSVRAGDRPWSRAMAGRISALVASAAADHAAARSRIEAALQAHRELPEPFEHARTLHIAGRIERSARNWGAARARFVDALERFDGLGAARWSEKVAADLARLPGRRAADRRQLTVREREVAELVASGLANKEVAGRLFVSRRTVEATLSKVYAKLGVRSRTELASTMRRGETD